MKKLFFLAVLFLSPGFNFAQTIVSIFDTAIVARTASPFDTTYWIKKKPETGSVYVYFDLAHTRPALQIEYLGKQRTNYRSWYSNGNKKEQRMNIDSLPWFEQDWLKWYENGTMQLYSRTTADSIIGINWFPDGAIVYDKRVAGYGHWNFTKCTGLTKTYNGKGIVLREDIFMRDSTITNFLFSDGKVATKTVYVNDSTSAFGSHEHFMQSYHQNGKIANTPIYAEKGRQNVTWFDSSGFKIEEGDWLNGRIGAHKEFYQNGSLKAEGEYSVREKHFTTTTSVNYCPVKSGHWKYYDETGKIIREEWYDELNRKYKTYDANGNVLTEGNDKIEAIGCG